MEKREEEGGAYSTCVALKQAHGIRIPEAHVPNSPEREPFPGWSRSFLNLILAQEATQASALTLSQLRAHTPANKHPPHQSELQIFAETA